MSEQQDCKRIVCGDNGGLINVNGEALVAPLCSWCLATLEKFQFQTIVPLWRTELI